MDPGFDLYKILGVSPAASQDAIKSAYRTLAKKYHPDLNPGKNTEERLKLINIAYDIVGDVGKRRKYDFMRQFESQYGPAYSQAYSRDFGNFQYMTFEEYMERILREIQNMSPEELRAYLNAQLDIFYNNLVMMVRQGIRQIGEDLQRTVRDVLQFPRKLSELFFPRISRILNSSSDKSTKTKKRKG